MRSDLIYIPDSELDALIQQDTPYLDLTTLGLDIGDEPGSLLLGMRPDDLRIPESFTVAAEEGLTFTIHPVELREAHPNTAVLTVEGISGKKTCVQAVSIGGGRIRVDKLDGVAVNFTGAFNTLIVRHMDVPGELATLTREISNADINIANMSLVRDRRGGSVMTIFEIDQPVPAGVIEKLKEVPHVIGVVYYEKEGD